MTPEKKARLERRGWRTGGFAEFLGLNPKEEARIKQRVQEYTMNKKMTPSFRPAHDQILIRPLKAGDETTASGLFTGKEADKMARGVVLSFGPGRLTPEGGLAPMAVQVADVIVYPPGSGREVDVEGVKLRLVSNAAIVGIIR